MFNKKYWKIVKWIISMKRKHGVYSFKLLCSSTEIIIYVEGTESKEDELRVSIFKKGLFD